MKELCPLIECAITNYGMGHLMEIYNPVILGSHSALLEANYDLWTLCYKVHCYYNWVLRGHTLRVYGLDILGELLYKVYNIKLYKI